MKENIQAIHQKCLASAKLFKRAEFELIENLVQAERFRIYSRFGHNSLFQYSVKELGLSANVTCAYINVARKMREVPQLKTAIKDGSVSVYKANRIAPVLTPSNQEHWIQIAKTKSKNEIERRVAQIAPKTLVYDKATPVHPNDEIKEKIIIHQQERVQAVFGVSIDIMNRFRDAQNLVSNAKGRHASLEDTLEVMLNIFIKNKCPLEKAKRQQSRGKLQDESKDETKDESKDETKAEPQIEDKSKTMNKSKTEPFSKTQTTNHKHNAAASFTLPGHDDSRDRVKTKRTHIPARTQDQLNIKLNRRCTQTDKSGNRCPEKRWLHFHHITPVEKGGSNHISNLTLLCAGHHRALHIQIE